MNGTSDHARGLLSGTFSLKEPSPSKREQAIKQWQRSIAPIDPAAASSVDLLEPRTRSRARTLPVNFDERDLDGSGHKGGLLKGISNNALLGTVLGLSSAAAVAYHMLKDRDGCDHHQAIVMKEQERYSPRRQTRGREDRYSPSRHSSAPSGTGVDEDACRPDYHMVVVESALSKQSPRKSSTISRPPTGSSNIGMFPPLTVLPPYSHASQHSSSRTRHERKDSGFDPAFVALPDSLAGSFVSSSVSPGYRRTNGDGSRRAPSQPPSRDRVRYESPQRYRGREDVDDDDATYVTARTTRSHSVSRPPVSGSYTGREIIRTRDHNRETSKSRQNQSRARRLSDASTTVTRYIIPVPSSLRAPSPPPAPSMSSNFHRQASARPLPTSTVSRPDDSKYTAATIRQMTSIGQARGVVEADAWDMASIAPSDSVSCIGSKQERLRSLGLSSVLGGSPRRAVGDGISRQRRTDVDRLRGRF